MENINTLVGSPITEEVGDLTLTIYPLSDYRIGEIDNWIKSRHINMAMTAAAGLAPAQANQLIDIALKQASSMTFLSAEGAKLMGTVDGIAAVLYFGQSEEDRKKHPMAAIQKQLTSSVMIRKANLLFKRLNVDPLMEVTSEKPGKPKPKARARRKKKASK